MNISAGNAPTPRTKRLLPRPLALADLEVPHRISNYPPVRRYMWHDEPVSRIRIEGVIRESERMFSVGAEVSEEQAYEAARLTALAMLASLKRAVDDLDRITAWLRIFGMVNSAPGFDRQPNIINGFSDLILDLYGPDAGDHTRSAVGMAELPLGIPVEIEAEVEIRPG